MPRKKHNPSEAAVPDSEVGNTARVQMVPASVTEQQQLVRDSIHVADELRDESMTRQQADAQRDIPRTIRPEGEHAERLRRPLPGAGTRRAMLSSRRKKALSSQKTAWQRNSPRTRLRTTQNVMQRPEVLEEINREVRGTLGRRSDMPPAVERTVHRMDLAIQDFERTNDREHIVYSRLMAPTGEARDEQALRRALQRMARDGETMTFDGYIPATHSLGNMPEGSEIVMEIQTYSGAYLGKSDSQPDADHIIGRGRRLQVVGVDRVEYAKLDGTTGQRWVAQMRDVSDMDGN